MNLFCMYYKMEQFYMYRNAELRHYIRMMRKAPFENKIARILCKCAIDYLKIRYTFQMDKDFNGNWIKMM